MYFNFDTVNEMHLEVTNRCNAACPMCARNYFGGKTKKDIELSEWGQESIPKIFDKRFKNLRNVLFCGTHGDPAASKSSLSAVNYLKENFDCTIEFCSNGGVQSESWWAELGKKLNHKREVEDYHYRQNDLGIFSVDGIGEVSAIYRRNTNFEKVMANARAFIAAGGIARWDFIVFKHNEHQVEEARDLAKNMGFKQFRVRKTSRFSYSPDGPAKHRVLSDEGELEYYLEPPTNPEYFNEQIDVFEALKKEFGSVENYFNSAEIECLYKKRFQRIYINAFEQVFPCCYLSNDVYPAKNSIAADTVTKVFERYGMEFNNLGIQDWESILNHEWFSKQLEGSWRENLQGGKLMRCSRTCGKRYSPIMSQSKDYFL